MGLFSRAKKTHAAVGHVLEKMEDMKLNTNMNVARFVLKSAFNNPDQVNAVQAAIVVQFLPNFVHLSKSVPSCLVR